MTKPEPMTGHLLAFAIPAAYTLLPPSMNSRAATAMLIAIALQESRCEHRRQIRGPARGFWQFERAGGVAGVLSHPSTSTVIRQCLTALRYSLEQESGEDDTWLSLDCHAAIEHNDTLAACFARCLLWTLPNDLPQQSEPDEAWRQYISAWRPGKPHRSTWNAFYAKAWSLVSQEE